MKKTLLKNKKIISLACPEGAKESQRKIEQQKYITNFENFKNNNAIDNQLLNVKK